MYSWASPYIILLCVLVCGRGVRVSLCLWLFLHCLLYFLPPADFRAHSVVWPLYLCP